MDAPASRGRATVGTLLVGGAAAHALAAYAAIVPQLPLHASFAFLLGQVLIALSLLRDADGAWVAQDIRLFFVVCYALYGATRPLAVLLGFVEPDAMLPEACTLYATGLLGFNLVQWIFREPWQAQRMAAAIDERPGPLLPVVVLGTVAACYGFAISRGVSLGLDVDRSRVDMVYSQGWIVLNFLTAGTLMYAVAAMGRRGTPGRLAVLVAVAAFVTLHLSFGNRRDFLPLLLFVFALVATRRRLTVGVGQASAAVAAFVVLLGLGIIRQVLLDPTLLLADPWSVFFGANEFVSPIVTLVYYLGETRDLLLGSSYLTWASLFVPRAIWAGKPRSPGQEFMLDAFGTTDFMGYAYTPVTEAFRNFGWVGPFIVFLVLSLAMVYLVRHAPRWPRSYFVLYALTLDYNRGETGSIIYAIVMILVGYGAAALVSSVRLARSPVPCLGRPQLTVRSGPRARLG